jgi:hypothetical protein
VEEFDLQCGNGDWTTVFAERRRSPARCPASCLFGHSASACLKKSNQAAPHKNRATTSESEWTDVRKKRKGKGVLVEILDSASIQLSVEDAAGSPPCMAENILPPYSGDAASVDQVDPGPPNLPSDSAPKAPPGPPPDKVSEAPLTQAGPSKDLGTEEPLSPTPDLNPLGRLVSC